KDLAVAPIEDVPAIRPDYLLVADSVPALIGVIAPDGAVEGVNRAVLDYFGASLEEIKGWATSKLVHPDDIPAVIASQKHSFETGERLLSEHRLLRADGVYRWFKIYGEPLRNAEGEIVQWYMLQTDIDDLKRAESLLSGEKRLLEMVALGRPLHEILDSLCRFVEQTAPECQCAVFLIDPAEHKFDKGFAPSLGDAYTVPLRGVPVVPGSAPCGAAAVDKTQVIAFDIETDPRWLGSAYHDHALAFGLRAVWSTPIVSRSGEVLGTFAVYQRHPGSPTQIQQDLIAQFTHIASIAIARAQSDNAIRRSEAFLAEGQRLSSTGSFYWRRTTDEIICSDETYRIFGIEPGTPVTVKLIASRIHPDDSERFNKRVEERRADGTRAAAEYRLLLPDGSIKFVHLVSQTTPTESGRMEYTGVIRDVTDARVAEETLGKLRSELAHVARVTTLGALTASIAHEVNQPLAGIVTNASTCLRMLAADPPNVEGARETARRTIRDGERASEVIARLRALFTKKTTTTGSIDLNEATREVVALSMSELQRQRVATRLELADDLPSVKGDRVQLQQVILNLLLNAGDAMSTVDDGPRELVIATSSDGADVHLSVRDSGIGFDAGDPDRIFDAFYTTKSSGMGIGLSVSRSIMELHGGRLLAARNSGPGATFSFSIPREARDVLGAPGVTDRHQGIMVG
ncbi:MAG TPA: PAS domain-containing protein, partial [Gemmatimonadaceae bacterium]|nr:PAS domain-containing protein [Gemmatimonadaceae bacterium]